MMKRLCTLMVISTLVLAVAGCGNDSDEATSETQTAANGDEFNDADVAFASDMIQHHAQALQLVDMTTGRDLDPEVLQLAEDGRAAQVPEIEQMAAWLTSWDQPIPATVRDHANAHGEGDVEMDDTPGMMSEDDMSQLEAAQGPEFEDLWLEMMIEHHAVAVDMAQTEQSEGVFQPAIDLADSIETSQEKEIDQMERLLGS